MSLSAGFSGAGTTPWGTKPPLRVPEPPEQVPVDAAVTTTTNPRTPGFTGRSRVTRNVTYGYVLRFPTMAGAGRLCPPPSWYRLASGFDLAQRAELVGTLRVLRACTPRGAHPDAASAGAPPVVAAVARFRTPRPDVPRRPGRTILCACIGPPRSSPRDDWAVTGSALC